jgi:hypothetical protein
LNLLWKFLTGRTGAAPSGYTLQSFERLKKDFRCYPLGICGLIGNVLLEAQVGADEDGISLGRQPGPGSKNSLGRLVTRAKNFPVFY